MCFILQTHINQLKHSSLGIHVRNRLFLSVATGHFVVDTLNSWAVLLAVLAGPPALSSRSALHSRFTRCLVRCHSRRLVGWRPNCGATAPWPGPGPRGWLSASASLHLWIRGHCCCHASCLQHWVPVCSPHQYIRVQQRRTGASQQIATALFSAGKWDLPSDRCLVAFFSVHTAR